MKLRHWNPRRHRALEDAAIVMAEELMRIYHNHSLNADKPRPVVGVDPTAAAVAYALLWGEAAADD